MITWARRQKPGVKLVVLFAVALLVGLFAYVGFADDEPTPVPTRAVTIPTPVVRGAPERIPLDATLYLPDTTPAPAVLLAHGFGGDKDSIANQARGLARAGYVVLAYTARGFGKSGGTITLNDPDREVSDASTLIDWLATQREVLTDSAGDPRVAVVGGSYGGALALSAAGLDHRIDAVVAAMTWNNLGDALFPNATGTATARTPAASAYGADGVLKIGWAGSLFGAGSASDEPTGAGTPCGRFDPTICELYSSSVTTGHPTARILDLLRRHSPTATNAQVRAPTLLLQGELDTLFGLDQADANAREITAGGGNAAMEWYYGGHGAARQWLPERSIRKFLDDNLRGGTPAESGSSEFDPAFRYALVADQRVFGQSRYQLVTAPDYPGITRTADPRISTTLSSIAADGKPTGPQQRIVRPPGATPQAISSVPGLSQILSSIGTDTSSLPIDQLATDLPGQAATFSTGPLDDNLRIVGTSTVKLRITATVDAADTALYAKVYDEDPGGGTSLIGGSVAAFRLPAGTPANTLVDVDVSLPAMAHQFAAGHAIRIAVATTDQGYLTPSSAASYTVELANPALVSPTVPGAVSDQGESLSGKVWAIVALVGGALALFGAFALISRRRRRHDLDPDLADVPLAVSGVTKTYGDLRVVDDVTFQVLPGQVLGLLGPNGAGKTTTLRMLMGLITPSAGAIRVFGYRVSPGSMVLSRVGSFVESAGFLPGVSGRTNLELYWAATGRPIADAHLDDALAIAGLGDAVDRKVRSYSQGMRQRLAIAQAMLGLPDLLVLDEPTNGLDPPQIRAMRDVLRDYAATGRTVLVSSHLLAEVEQTCSHVVVMNRGRVLRAGSVADLTDDASRVDIGVTEVDSAIAALTTDASVVEATAHPSRADVVQVQLTDRSHRAAVLRRLVEADVDVTSLEASNSLEDVFLEIIHSAEPPQQEVTS